MTDIDISSFSDHPPKINIMEDLDIFSGGHDSSAKSDSTHIPKISEVESNVRGDGAKSPGLVSKVTNFWDSM